MEICIHRGTKEIGGTCIEVRSQGQRIALDVGLPLNADGDTDTLPLLPKVSGFRERDDTLLGVIISHPHMDHYGLATHLRADLPIYIGERANKILEAASRYVPNGTYFRNAVHYEAWKPTTIGPFTITPYLNDHSAFDAYSMWRGYLDEDYLKDFTAWLKARGIPMSQIHTSGHAPIADLQRFAKALAPKKLAPIHSFDTGSFTDYFDNVEQKEDGEWWSV